MSEAELPDAGHLYTPMFWYGDTEWAPRAGYCRASVHDGGRSVGFHQCCRKIKVERHVRNQGKAEWIGYCTMHDPVNLARKRAEQAAAWRAKWAAQDAAAVEASRLRKLRDAAVEALKLIAAGHNDPRTLAKEVLETGGLLSSLKGEGNG